MLFIFSISFIFASDFVIFLFILYIWVVKVSLSLHLSASLFISLALSVYLPLASFVLFYGVSFMIRSISLQWMFGPFMLPCNIYYIGWLIVCLFAGWLAVLVMLLLLFCSHSVFIRHDIYKFHICGHIFIHAYVIKPHRICAESLRKYPNTTHITLEVHTACALSHTYRNYFSNINTRTRTHTYTPHTQ